ncbi:methyltransferase domain-containing protein [Shewanella rhizosphaerae]|uniref:class I SAM-dependent methyltransferase n=1 Tax=Shewanella rhizosphaerae TaxID=2864207 RepID=UPI001C65FAF0|nr:methyltransferase domain-containing protein [Shewanella rhizosphaerae]QYK13702.1 methyltransferase domain-containing protein [Shewanella rhizosphaerae]
MDEKRLRAEAAPLLTQSSQIFELDSHPQVLDLACGSGRNGLWLAAHGAQVTFIDRDLGRLAPVPRHCQALALDLESGEPQLAESRYDIVLVFNYLHRPLFELIKASIKPGGLIIYETFIEKQAEVGRPKNPNFLLAEGELSQRFCGWETLHAFEGNVGCEETPCFKAQYIGRKPAN